MENASKALIIAGAILISIVLVSVGVIVVQSLDPSSATEKMDEQAVQAFNAKFDAYIGTNVSGTNVRSLMSAVATNNKTYSDDESKQITIILDEKTLTNENINAERSKVGTGNRYIVEITDTQASGIIKTITINKK